MKLSNNFYLKEFKRSKTARKHNIDNSIPKEYIINIKKLVVNILQPLSDLIGNVPITISSGYRCEKLNKKVKGSKHSAHKFGMAADIEVHSKDLKDIYKLIMENIPHYDELIYEFDEWIHISLKPSGNRKRNRVFEWKDGKKIKRDYIENEF